MFASGFPSLTLTTRKPILTIHKFNSATRSSIFARCKRWRSLFDKLILLLAYVSPYFYINCLNIFIFVLQAKQEEDNLGADRLKKGYQVAVTSYEHDSIVWNVKVIA